MEHRDKRPRGFPAYDPLDVGDDQRDTSPPTHNLILVTRVIPMTTLRTWGPPDVAAERALLETEVTEETEELARTFHPAFVDTDSITVRLTIWRCGRSAWVIDSTNIVLCYTHACGLPIYLAPHRQFPNDRPGQIIPGGSDLIWHTLNPRRIMTEDDLDRIRMMFPQSCGVRTWLSGTIEVLYPSLGALQRDQCATPTTVGGSPVQLNVLKCYPSSNVQCGEAVAPSSNSLLQSCLGLKLTLPDGEPVLTTVTHGFVRPVATSGSILDSIKYTAVNTFWAVKDAMLKFRTPGRLTFDEPYVHPSQTPTSNSALGKIVQKFAGQTIGKIGATFDSPSQTRPYPAGYQHDLSLIIATSESEEAQLPELSSPAGLPKISGWADVTNALDGQSVYLTSTIPHTAQVISTHRFVLTAAVRRILKQSAEPGTAEAIQYTWDRAVLSQSVSLLWRCVPPPEELDGLPAKSKASLERINRSVQGQSGSVLCLGKTTDATSKALVFQNFETSLETWAESPLNDNGRVHIKGGFLLPGYISDQCTIHHDVVGFSAEHPKFSTEPRASFKTNAQGRSFSGPV